MSLLMQYTGSQSTIISRSTLHALNRNLHVLQEGKKLPPLELPTARLYGKDGPKGGRELVITAQISLSFSVDGKSVRVPVFVQPDSEQACLSGINAMSALGFKVLSGNESVVMPNVCPTSAPVLAMVSLVHSVAVPSYYSCIVRTKLSSPISTSDNLLFEPEPEALVLLGLNACESVVAASEDNEVLLTVQNYQGITVHLESGLNLGSVRATTVINMDSQHDSVASTTASVKAISCTHERVKQLLTQVSVSSNQL